MGRTMQALLHPGLSDPEFPREFPEFNPERPGPAFKDTSPGPLVDTAVLLSKSSPPEAWETGGSLGGFTLFFCFKKVEIYKKVKL